MKCDFAKVLLIYLTVKMPADKPKRHA